LENIPMTITYPAPQKANRRAHQLPPVAPTPALRADVALADAHRFLGVGMGQALMATTFAVLLSNMIQEDLSVAWLVGVSLLLGALMAGFMWAVFQGQRFGTAPYSSGLSHNARGAAKYVMYTSFGVIALGLLVPIAMFLTWERNIPFPTATGLMQLALLLGQLLLSVSMSLRAIEAIKYARAQLSDNAGNAGPNGGGV
jgi:hypothetical protein